MVAMTEQQQGKKHERSDRLYKSQPLYLEVKPKAGTSDVDNNSLMQ